MNREGLMDPRDVKKAIRDQAHANRRAQENKDALSQVICEKFTALENMDELAVGMYKILEPKPELRDLPGKRVDVTQLDLIMAPGVAFDPRGARMGHGFGYYDKLLEHARADAPLVALAFECQIFPEIPTQPHDIFMDKIITEKTIYQGKGRQGS
jgi:5-formyltetrahydrofolate cyclo-ligase